MTVTPIPALAAAAVTAQVEALLTPGEVAAAFRVDRKTVTRWAKAGRLPCVRTPGGHRRYPAGPVHALLTAHAPGNATGNATRSGGAR